MYIKEYMNTKVITANPDTLIHDAAQIMQERGIRRLPVVDKGKLVGIVTRDKIREATTSLARPLSIWELNYLLSKMKVRDVMEKKVITVTPNTTVEQAVRVGQEHGVGAFPVVEGNRLVGIVTTTDLYKVTTQAFGFGQPGARLHVLDYRERGSTAELIDVVNRSGARIISLFHVTPPQVGKEDCIIHLDTSDATAVTSALRARGYQVEERAH